MSITFNGGSFERFLPQGQDCSLLDFVVADPTPAQLQCLTFSLPSTVTVPSNDLNQNNILVNQMTFVDTSPACGGSDLVSRLSTAYGHNVSGLRVIASFNQDINPYNVVYLMAGFDVSKPQYVLEYNNPICGVSAPKLIDNSADNRVTLSSANVDEKQTISLTDGDFQTVLSQAYGSSAKAIKSQFISYSKIQISQLLKTRAFTISYLQTNFFRRVYSLVDYDLGNNALVAGANLRDGCIDEFSLGNDAFVNSSEACGGYYPSDRFPRYFNGYNNDNLYALDEAIIYFKLFIDNGGRRAPGDTTFYYVDKSFLPIATTAQTTLSTSTVISSTFVSSLVSSTTIAVRIVTTVEYCLEYVVYLMQLDSEGKKLIVSVYSEHAAVASIVFGVEVIGGKRAVDDVGFVVVNGVGVVNKRASVATETSVSNGITSSYATSTNHVPSSFYVTTGLGTSTVSSVLTTEYSVTMDPSLASASSTSATANTPSPTYSALKTVSANNLAIKTLTSAAPTTASVLEQRVDSTTLSKTQVSTRFNVVVGGARSTLISALVVVAAAVLL
ncbi:hypothetical protein BCR33DRAFT_745805 [Rhizoclosmatium globosum]|uniref:Uncharacterized protein n=1 Tax=Rhizoclosmatium globosum TaxID=329046 RepID=A0A1Y2B209_9FUNG|nr:hypothetical protein BCR33DRAFT_745805 [Rhizoclosmatium globosum]|eukprot:ORY28115.1 hypothetical protein BCR33DRAFT_745805 [Rhizoclosmatium globosum]